MNSTMMNNRLKSLMPFAGLILVIVLFAFLTGGRYVSGNNITMLLKQAFTVVLVSIGVTIIYAHGGMDFSVGAVLALSQMTAAFAYQKTGAPILLIIVCVVVAAACGFITGTITIRLNISPFISSLCMQFAARGVVNSVLTGNAIGVSELSDPGWEIKIPILVVIMLFMLVLLRYTRVGKYNKAIGENIRAAEISGINSKKYRLYAYLISGVILGVASYFDMLRNGTITTNVGQNLELDVIIALVLGGMSLTGGYSTSVRSAVIGGFIVVLLTNGLTMIGLKSDYIGIIEGIIFVLVVLSTYSRDRKGLLPK